MALKRFKTNRALWGWISLVLFIGAWFLPFYSYWGNRAADAWIVLFEIPLSDVREIMGPLVMICFCAVLFGIPAICIGWVLQCIIIMIRGEGQERSMAVMEIPPGGIGGNRRPGPNR
jgi:hypothetical protein